MVKTAQTSDTEDLYWYPNKNWLKNNTWKHTYRIEFGVVNWNSQGPLKFILSAPDQGTALDLVIDYMAEEFPNVIMPSEEVENLDPNVDASYITGGQDGLTINFSTDQMHSVELTEEERLAAVEEMLEEDEPCLKMKMKNYLIHNFGISYEDEAEIAIYWFASRWHGGQTSELYSILSTSPYTPGPSTDLTTEDETIQDMYHALENNFKEHSFSTKEEWEWLESKKAELKEAAFDSCGFRGHDMGEWEDNKEISSISHCVICGKYVQVILKPMPNQIDIGGDALAHNCKSPYELATPEELLRDLGIG